MTKLSNGAWRSYLAITIGCFIVMISLNLFLIPYKLAPGGVSGLATVIHYLSDGKLPVGALMLAFNAPLFLLGYKVKGRIFTVRSLYGAVLLSVFVDSTSSLFNRVIHEYLTKFDQSMSEPDLLLNAIIGGAIMGFGLGMVLSENATTGGTDLGSTLLSKKIPILKVGQYLMLLDGLVILFSAIAFRSIKLGMYGAFSLYICSKVIDAYLEGLKFSKGLLIISDKSDEIANRIMNDIGRGVTGLNGMGMYSRTNKTVLLCVVKREEIPNVKDIVKECDSNAFMLLIDVREVLGEGFIPLSSPSNKE
jgi:uncharacterized membrane-anchored protein YitT (DUF2179 family)